MRLDHKTIQDIAVQLADAEKNRVPVPRIETRYPEIDYANARCIALARDELRVVEGRRRLGYKLGWTSSAMRDALGIDQPNWGTLWDYMQIGSEVAASQFIHAKAEPEIAFIATENLTGQPTSQDVIDSKGYWALAIEIVDPRWPSYEFSFEENTADNSSAAGFVLGEKFQFKGDPNEIEIRFSSQDGARVGRGANAMGSPAEAVAWFTGCLNADGTPLFAGDIVLTGGLTAPADIFAGQSLRVESRGLPTVTVDITG